MKGGFGFLLVALHNLKAVLMENIWLLNPESWLICSCVLSQDCLLGLIVFEGASWGYEWYKISSVVWNVIPNSYWTACLSTPFRLLCALLIFSLILCVSMWAACIGQEIQYVRVPYFKERFSLFCLFSAILCLKPNTRSWIKSKAIGREGCDFNFLLPNIQFFTWSIFFCSSSSSSSDLCWVFPCSTTC